VFPIAYARGRSPRTQNEIALSHLNADALGTEVGDAITVVIDGRPRELTVCGIYSDVTNGGRTAKAVFDESLADVLWSVVAAELVDSAVVDHKVQAYSDRFDFAKVSGIEEFIRQTFGTTIESIRRVSSIAFVVALTISLLVSLLFVRMLVARDRYPIAVLKAVGYTTADIRTQYAIGSILIATLGVLFGTLLANTSGEALARMAIAWFGASSFDFTIDVGFSYFIGPLSMVAVTIAGTLAATRKVATVTIYENIKE
jgi:putative ABC transport system permease protein